MDAASRTTQDENPAAPQPATAPPDGAAQSSTRLFELAYADLKRMAHARLERNGGRGDLDTTSLVHESFLRVVESGELQIAERPALLAYMARVMRSVIIDHVRTRQALKRGGDRTVVTLTTGAEAEAFDDERLLAMNAALEVVARMAPELHRLIELRYFAGMSVRELAECSGMSVRSVEREWVKARALLRELMQEDSAKPAVGGDSGRANPGPRSD